MKFNIVLGNPPYNNDLYIPFVQLAFALSTHYTVMITPAKWQAKAGHKNEAFRNQIVPHMSKIVYYPDCSDVFAIGDPGGISYYLIDKNNTYKDKVIENISFKQRLYNDEETRNFDTCSLCNKGTHIADKVMTISNSISVEKLNKNYKYQVWSANKVSLVSNLPETYLWSKDGMFNCLGLQQVTDRDTKKIIYETDGVHKSYGVPVDSKRIFSSDSLDECKSFIRYCYTRMVRYLLSLSLSGLTGIATNDEWWRFVPDPGSFNKIFEDSPLPGYTPNEDGEYIDSDGNTHCSLYYKYHLTPSEIQIIESVIKPRV